MMTRGVAIVVAMVLGGMCGCGTVPRSKYYQLTAPGEASSAPAGDPLPLTLLVSPLKASHLYREDRLVYATESEEMGTYQLFATGGGAPAGGMMTKPPSIPRPFWGYYFNVPAIDAAADRVKAAGGTILMGPHEVPGGQWIVQCKDPQDAYFALVARKR